MADKQFLYYDIFNDSIEKKKKKKKRANYTAKTGSISLKIKKKQRKKTVVVSGVQISADANCIGRYADISADIDRSYRILNPWLV